MKQSKVIYSHFSVVDFLKDESGQGTVEYVLIAAALCIVGYAGVKFFGEAFGSKFNKLSSLRAGPTIGIGP